MTFLRASVCSTAMKGKNQACLKLLKKLDAAAAFPFARAYSSTPASLLAEGESGSEAGSASGGSPEAVSASEKKKQRRAAALEYNRSRAAYKRRVGKLRHDYRVEHERHTALDLAERDAAVAATTRRRLERQRAKNERSLRNAIRQEELRRQNAAVFADHLERQQEVREAHQKLHQRARQLLIDELEEESKDWLTTPEEVEAAFADPETEQMLWARPQGVLGVPNPSLDSHFWSHEGHTWDRSKTYKTRSQVLLQQLEEEAYTHTNVDYDTVWTEERLGEARDREDKARLRANVRIAGRRALLQRQKDYLAREHDEGSSREGEPPKPPPVPSLGVLGNVAAQEKEGAELLLGDPTRFFVFSGGEGGAGAGDESSKAPYAGSSLGVPVAIRDPLRTGQPQGRVFPVPVGKLPKPDLRTEKEKKRQEREERLWAAAAGKASGESDEDLMLIAEEDREIGEAIDYEEAHANWDSDDEDWAKGLDKDLDRDLLNLPREFRYNQEDIEAVIERLESRAEIYQSHVKNTIRTMEQEARSRLDRSDTGDDEPGKQEAADSSSSGEDKAPFFDASTAEKLRSVGADVEKYERLMASLTDDQLLTMFALEANSSSSGTSKGETEGSEPAATESARTQVFEGIPGLSPQQIAELTELESFIKVAETESSSATN